RSGRRDASRGEGEPAVAPLHRVGPRRARRELAGAAVAGRLRLQLRRPRPRPAPQLLSRVRGPRAEDPRLRDDRPPDRAADARLPARPRRRPPGGLREGARGADGRRGAEAPEHPGHPELEVPGDAAVGGARPAPRPLSLQPGRLPRREPDLEGPAPRGRQGGRGRRRPARRRAAAGHAGRARHRRPRVRARLPGGDRLAARLRPSLTRRGAGRGPGPPAIRPRHTIRRVTHRQPDPAPGAEPERGFVIAVLAQGRDPEDELAELRELARTAGVEPAGQLTQFRELPDRRTYLGKGKREELKQAFGDAKADVLLVDDELEPPQQRRLEDELEARVVDRTQLILDIFAQHTRSAEGKLQVELAQLEYNLPRMRGLWQHLERLGGGVGTRGPGESQLE